ncbi:hypothetical protein I3843_16G091100 [Carya illinoinensis]|nr:hypothetical protein I3843_16G091100 [Carya illinoinensis]
MAGWWIPLCLNILDLLKLQQQVVINVGMPSLSLWFCHSYPHNQCLAISNTFSW